MSIAAASWNPSQPTDPFRRRALLYRVPLFHGLPVQALDELAMSLHLETRPAGVRLAAAGEPATRFFVIAYGRCKLVLEGESDRQLTLGLLGPGDFFGEATLLEEAVHPAGVETLEPTTLLVFSQASLMAHLRSRPQIALILATELTRRLRSAAQLVADLGLYDVHARLERALLALAEAEGERSGEGIWLRSRPTQQDLANRIGACRETVSRALGSLAKQGMVEIRGRDLLLRQAFLNRRKPA